jgi:hypothetical protein
MVSGLRCFVCHSDGLELLSIDILRQFFDGGGVLG